MHDALLFLDPLIGECHRRPRIATPLLLLRSFKRAIGMTPHEYQLQARVRRAYALVRRSEGRLADIAANVGFADQAHLTRHFKNIMGATPGQVRRAIVLGSSSAVRSATAAGQRPPHS